MPLQNIKRGGHFGFLTGMWKGMWIVQTISYTGTPTPESHRPKLGLRSTSLNAITEIENFLTLYILKVDITYK